MPKLSESDHREREAGDLALSDTRMRVRTSPPGGAIAENLAGAVDQLEIAIAKLEDRMQDQEIVGRDLDLRLKYLQEKLGIDPTAWKDGKRV